MKEKDFILYEWNAITKEFWFLGKKIDYIHNPNEWREHLNNLVKENKRLKEQINATNISINNWISSSKAEMQEYGYNHEKYWGMFKELLEKIKKELNGKENSNYAVIDREREQELLDKEDRINKAIELLNIIIKETEWEDELTFSDLECAIKILRGEENEDI